MFHSKFIGQIFNENCHTENIIFHPQLTQRFGGGGVLVKPYCFLLGWRGVGYGNILRKKNVYQRK